ncbi:type II toxin-antitoxin system HigB family toxin [Pedobacter rhodius]|uniref:Type II toxin-antitoxin system HigB family toxin n=1 Tax=Pedobacter rhodius TaxID=3004098 RepID=A0ABT4L1E0_9SPHI|nr:type II toxin-antitoxin system HigB family toxin [Pedobacter sp. SJ11]MCZ4225004.1 type II toxin-antitoxin system HigB family toxin [Pedobacter sp. SJ11]
MRIIYLKKLQDFSRKHSDAIKSISVFKSIVEKAYWKTSIAIIESFPSAKVLNSQRARLKIVGNEYRIIVEVDFIDQTVEIRFVGTHAEYDKVDALTI